jgi:hypothetical protein
MSHQVAEYLAAGMDGHVGKPIRAGELFETIVDVMSCDKGAEVQPRRRAANRARRAAPRA